MRAVRDSEFRPLGRAVRVIAALVIASLLSVAGTVARAAELECINVLTTPIPAAVAQKAWPSGFRPVVGACQTAYLEGQITKGDYDKFLAFYRKNHRFLHGLALQSEGGDVSEAIKIGRLVRKYLVMTYAPTSYGALLGGDSFHLNPCRGSGAPCVCASACALIWFGGVDRSGIVGLHRPRMTDPEFKTLPLANAARIYRDALDQISRYLDEMEAPRSTIDAMVATDSADIVWLDSDKEKLTRPPSIAEWIDASCGHFTSDEEQQRSDLDFKTIQQVPLSSSDALLLKLLNEKNGQHIQCGMFLKYNQVDRLSPP